MSRVNSSNHRVLLAAVNSSTQITERKMQEKVKIWLTAGDTEGTK